MAAEYEEFIPKGSTQSTSPEYEEFTPRSSKPLQKPLSGKDLFARRLGLLTRIPYEAATGTVGALGDFGAGVMGLATGKYTPSPIGSQSIRQQLNKFLPEPKGFEENAIDILGQIGMGRLDMAGAGLARGAGALAPQVAPGFVSAADTARQTAKELHKAGLKILPSEGKGGVLGKVMIGAGDETRVAHDFQNFNQEATERLARQATQLNPQLALTRENLIDRAATIAEQGYAPVRKVPYVGIGSKYRKELQEIANELATNKSFPAVDKSEVLKEVNRHLWTKVGADGMPTSDARVLQHYTGRDAIERISSLREEADSLFKSEAAGDKAVARAKKRIAAALEDQIDYSLERTGRAGVIEEFRDTRKKLAKNFAVRELLSDQYTGVINPTKAQGLKRRELTDELEILAKAGSPGFAKSTKAPSGESTLYHPWEVTAMVGGLGGTALPGPTQVLGPMVAASVASRPLFRKAVGSKAMQSLMYGDRPNLFSPEARLLNELQAARLLPTPFFSQGEQ